MQLSGLVKRKIFVVKVNDQHNNIHQLLNENCVVGKKLHLIHWKS